MGEKFANLITYVKFTITSRHLAPGNWLRSVTFFRAPPDLPIAHGILEQRVEHRPVDGAGRVVEEALLRQGATGEIIDVRRRIADAAAAVGHVGGAHELEYTDGHDLGGVIGAGAPDDAVVLAAGAHSKALARKLGADVPLETERGYHIVCPHPGIELSGPVMNGAGKFLVTPMAMGLRFAGTVELGGLDAPPTPRRIEAITKKAKDMVPGLNTEGMTTWLGFRPSLPDSLPVIGPSPKRAGVFFAFGHQHVGLTAGPRTGGLIADLVAGRAPNVDIAPYRADRF